MAHEESRIDLTSKITDLDDVEGNLAHLDPSSVPSLTERDAKAWVVSDIPLAVFRRLREAGWDIVEEGVAPPWMQYVGSAPEFTGKDGKTVDLFALRKEWGDDHA